MSFAAFQLLSPLFLCPNLRQSCEIELLSTSRQTKQHSTFPAGEGKDRRRDSGLQCHVRAH